MDDKDTPIRRFADELDDLIDRYQKQIPVGAIIGTMHLVTHYLCNESACRDLLEKARE